MAVDDGAMPASTGSSQHHANRRAFEPRSLDTLIDWCGTAVREALSDAPPGIRVPPPLPELLRAPLDRHGFDAFDEIALALALGPDLDPVIGVAMSELTGVRSSRYATVSVIADLVGAVEAERVAVAARLSTSGPLSRLGLVDIVPPFDAPSGGPIARGPSLLDSVVASTALLRWVFGITQLDPALFPLVRDDLTAPVVAPDPPSAHALAVRLSDAAPSITALTGSSHADNIATALHTAATVGRPALYVEASALFDARSAARVAAEALLRQAVVIAVGDVPAVPPHHWDAFASLVTVGAEPVVACDSDHDFGSLAIPSTSGRAIGVHLVDLLRDRGLRVAPPEAERLARWEHLRHEDLDHVAGVLAARAPRPFRGRERPSVTARDVAGVVVGGAGDDLARLATPLETARGWSQLVVPDELRRGLGELVEQAATRNHVLEGAGFTATPGQPRGVTAVFAGPSGTGKTFAARIVAGELGLPLYAINLAATVSKYIGETERNLETVFAAAERSDAVLLFDEADALFGRRSEVQDARDRYANLEVAFLLQRMERYDGVAILATNLLGHFDDAFARRLTFCLRFPYPDDGQRQLLWRSVWPEGAALADDVDLDDIAARHPFTGGNIRNVAVAAVHLARGRGDRAVGRASIERAIDREYAKLGQAPQAVSEALR
jgi:hypothetical protein